MPGVGFSDWEFPDEIQIGIVYDWLPTVNVTAPFVFVPDHVQAVAATPFRPALNVQLPGARLIWLNMFIGFPPTQVKFAPNDPCMPAQPTYHPGAATSVAFGGLSPLAGVLTIFNAVASDVAEHAPIVPPAAALRMIAHVWFPLVNFAVLLPASHAHVAAAPLQVATRLHVAALVLPAVVTNCGPGVAASGFDDHPPFIPM